MKPPIDDSIELQTVGRFRSPLMAVGGGALLLAAAITLFVTSDSWRYWLHSGKPQSLGHLEPALKGGKLKHNTYVSFDARALLDTEGTVKTEDVKPGCLTGPQRKLRYTLLADTGDRVIVRTAHSLKVQEIPRRTTFTGRLIRVDTDDPPWREYRRLIFKMTDCKHHPNTCVKRLLVSADIATSELLSKLGKDNTSLRGLEGETIRITSFTPIFLSFAYPDEYEYSLSHMKKEEALARVKALGVPYAYVGKSGAAHDFVLRAPKAKAEAWMKAQKRKSDYSISARSAGYWVRFGWLSRDGDKIKIRKVGKGFPVEYVRKPPANSGDVTQMRPLSHGNIVRVPIARVAKANYGGPRRLPKKLWVLVEGRKPADARAAAGLAGGLLGLALGGLLLLALGLRRAA